MRANSTRPSRWPWRGATTPRRWAARPAGCSTARRWPRRRWPSAALLARDRDDPAAARLATVRQQLAALTLASPKPGQEQERRQELDRLTAQERELSKEVGQNLGRPARDDPVGRARGGPPGPARRRRPGRDRSVRCLQLPGQGDREADGRPPHYAAWVIPPAGRGEVRLIDLGAADVIEADVAAVRRAIQPDLAALRERGEPAIETALRPSLEALADRVLRPLLPHIGDAKRWVLSPDAALWLVPWAALPLEKDRSAIEDHPIHYVVSGRDLAQAAAPPAAGQALVMADPDYDLDPAAVQQAARQVLRGRAAPPTELALRGLSRSFQLGSVPRLAGTATEARAIEPKLRAYAGSAPIVYTDRWALEAVFKAFQRPRIVVLSTHGFFLEDQHEEPRSDAGLLLETRGTGPKPVIQSENPLLRCGLLLAGCNRPQAGEGEDGVLDRAGDRRHRPARHRAGRPLGLRDGPGRGEEWRGGGRAAPGVPARRGGDGRGHALAGARQGLGAVDGRVLRQLGRRPGEG